MNQISYHLVVDNLPSLCIVSKTHSLVITCLLWVVENLHIKNNLLPSEKIDDILFHFVSNYTYCLLFSVLKVPLRKLPIFFPERCESFFKNYFTPFKIYLRLISSYDVSWSMTIKITPWSFKYKFLLKNYKLYAHVK